MTSWPDASSPQVRADLDRLLEAVLPLAEQGLAQRGEMVPSLQRSTPPAG